MLAVGVAGQTAGTFASATPSFLIPYLHLEQGLSLARAGALASAPLIGTMLTLVVWGLIVDRRGERLAMAGGLALATLGVGGSATAGADEPLALAAWWLLLGVGAASTSSASGRLVVGWFEPARRGSAMGIRQTALPLGMAAGALIVPALSAATDLRTTVLVVAAITGVVTLVTGIAIVDPPRPDRATAQADGSLANPYRGRHGLVRIHLASALLVIPQYTVWTFMLVWLIDTRGWSAGAAGVVVAAAQFAGAAGRIGAGWWTDRVGSRLRPMRITAAAAAVVMVALGVVESGPLGIAVMIAAAVITVADNGMAFTAVAEIGGPFWSGRALGLQNTGQYLTSAAVPPLIGLIISGPGYGWAFAAVAIFPLLAIPLVPVRSERAAEPVAEPTTSG